MYPSDELAHLRLRKQLLVAQSDLLRAQSAVAIGELARSVTLVESVVSVLKRLSPFLAIASLFVPRKMAGRRAGVFRLALKWGPALFRAFKWFKSSSSRAQPHPKYPHE